MTESVEAPKRIWIESDGECPYFYEEEELSDVSPPITEYVRADKLEELAAETEALRAEVESLRTDAERYRWLRDKGDSITVCDCASDGEWIPLHPQNIDATIDAAMKTNS